MPNQIGKPPMRKKLKARKYAEGGQVTDDNTLRVARATAERMGRAYDNATTRRGRDKAQLANNEANEREWARAAELGSPMAQERQGTKEAEESRARLAAMRRRLDEDRSDPSTKGTKFKRGGRVSAKAKKK
jgi:hypothetical protein